MISAEQVAKMLEEAMIKQQETFRFEMQMAMQNMREMHEQQIQALTNQQGEPSRLTRSFTKRSTRIRMKLTMPIILPQGVVTRTLVKT